MNRHAQPSIPARPASPQPAGSTVADFDKLDGVLRSLLGEHERLLALAKEHQRAIAQADAAGLSSILAEQAEILHRVTGLEQLRRALVSRLAGAMPKQGQPQTVTALAAHAPAPLRDRLTSVAAALRELLNTLHREHQAVRQAAETLSSHMEGLMRQVCRRLSHAGTYARGGGFDASVQVVSSLDVRS